MACNRQIIFGFLLLALACGCKSQTGDRIQGYVEGDFLYIAAPSGGRLEKLEVEKGDEVRTGQRLFSLEPSPENELREQAFHALRQAESEWEDAKKGSRETELQAREARLKQAESILNLAQTEFERQEKLSKLPGVSSKQDFDRARAARDEAQQKVFELKSEIATSRLGAREDRILSLESRVQAQRAILKRADWELAQKSQAAPEDGTIFDIVFRPGEYVAAGRPVLSLLPPERIKVRAFVPEPLLGRIRLGDDLLIAIDGRSDRVKGKVAFISSRPEYTPPFIYSRDNRAKFSFLIEIRVSSEDAQTLHPGQPVDVSFVGST